MKMNIRRSNDRGQADHGWLHSQHTFSFAGYRDARYMGLSRLRVINQDVVEPTRGFGTHPHRDMEILSYVVRGELEHKDTIGTGSIIRPGEVQLMSAGAGIAHSEFNPSDSNAVEFLQIWLMPSTSGGKPSYQQHDFGSDDGLVLVVSPDGRDGSLIVKQNADVWRLFQKAEQKTELSLTRPYSWVQVVRGQLAVNGALLDAGDGLAIEGAPSLELITPAGSVRAEALIFDLP